MKTNIIQCILIELLLILVFGWILLITDLVFLKKFDSNYFSILLFITLFLISSMILSRKNPINININVFEFTQIQCLIIAIFGWILFVNDVIFLKKFDSNYFSILLFITLSSMTSMIINRKYVLF